MTKFLLQNTPITLERLTTNEQRIKGYMGATNAPDDNSGLLFEFGSPPERHSFWMKNVPFNLDLVGLNEQNVVVEVLSLHANTTNSVTFTNPVAKAIELREGWCKEHGVIPGKTTLREAPGRLIENSKHISLEYAIKNLEQISINNPTQKGIIEEVIFWADIMGLQFLGGGVSRFVWVLDDKHVLKLINKTNTENQNKNEVEAFECFGGSDLFARIIHKGDKNHTWIISERLMINKTELFAYFDEVTEMALGFDALKNNTGINLFQSAIMQSETDSLSKQQRQANLNAYKSIIPWVGELAEIVRKCKIAQDFHEDNWGWRRGTDHPVLLDYGLLHVPDGVIGEQQEEMEVPIPPAWEKLGQPYINLLKKLSSSDYEADYVLPNLVDELLLNRNFEDPKKLKEVESVQTLQDFAKFVSSAAPKGQELDGNPLIFFWKDPEEVSFIEVMARSGMQMQRGNGINIIVHPDETTEPVVIAVDGKGYISSVEQYGIEVQLQDISQYTSDGIEAGLAHIFKVFNVKTSHSLRGQELIEQKIKLSSLMFN